MRLYFGVPYGSFPVDPQLSGFALGLLFAAAKIGFIGTIGFGVAWWRTRRKLQHLEDVLPDPGRLDERLASLEQNTDYIGAKLSELADTQALLMRQLNASPERPALPKPELVGDPQTPRTPH
ncbi:MAG TPA: hypothetical protein VH438_11215 [Gemmatimonadales bacterium]|jgi:hypothetical protein